jgi:hypothetical protein
MNGRTFVDRIRRNVFALLLAGVSSGTLTASHNALAQGLASQYSRTIELFVGDNGDSSVKRFDASTGAFLGTFIPAGTAGLNGLNGLIFSDGHLIVSNQNVGTDEIGEILRFDGRNGMFLGKLVAKTDRGASFAPQGIVRGEHDGSYYVADAGTQGNTCVSQGNIKVYNESALSGAAWTVVASPRSFIREAWYSDQTVFSMSRQLAVLFRQTLCTLR